MGRFKPYKNNKPRRHPRDPVYGGGVPASPKLKEARLHPARSIERRFEHTADYDSDSRSTVYVCTDTDTANRMEAVVRSISAGVWLMDCEVILYQGKHKHEQHTARGHTLALAIRPVMEERLDIIKNKRPMDSDDNTPQD